MVGFLNDFFRCFGYVGAILEKFVQGGLDGVS